MARGLSMTAPQAENFKRLKMRTRIFFEALAGHFFLRLAFTMRLISKDNPPAFVLVVGVLWTISFWKLKFSVVENHEKLFCFVTMYFPH